MGREKFLRAVRRKEEGPSPNQLSYVRVIRAYFEEHGYPPTYSEIGKLLGVTRNAVFEMVCRLERDGYLKVAVDEGTSRVKSRTMLLTKKGWQAR